MPVAAGLGGGSANAAGVLNALNQYYRVFTDERLHDIASSIGADVPFFLKGVPAWAKGIGDKLSILEKSYPPLYIVLVNPGFPVGVRWTYSKLDSSEFTAPDLKTEDELTEALLGGNCRKIANLCRNDLEKALYIKFPLLEQLRRNMLDSGALCVQISGSGPTLFAICSSAENARLTAENVRRDFRDNPGVRVFECEV